TILVLRRHRVVEAAPIVPLDEDRRRVPELALADRVHERGDPRRSVVVRAVGMVRIVADGRDPRKVCELAVAYVGDKLPVRRDDVFPPVGPIVDMLDGLITGPRSTVAARSATVLARVKPPREFCFIKLV